jgi:omega-hydroxy-beta-dihydromenaquinone-9 sulfotransferase
LKNYLTAGIELSRLLRLMRKNSISLRPRYLAAFLFLLQSSIWTELFSWIERKRYGKKITSTPAPEDPIFIIGHWRTGTTLLHQLLDLDPNLAAPTLFQVAEPSCFICSYRYYIPVFTALLPANRPMDNVKIGINEPQEDEYAIFRITDASPIEQIVFPKNKNYFLLDNTSFLPSDEIEIKIWGEKLREYYRKLHFFHGKRIISKNPFNSLRILELALLFPKARFIHIVRHPYDVVPSTLNMWKIVMHQNRLNHNGAIPCLDDVVKGVDKIITAIREDSKVLKKENYYEMRFEDLEADPVGELMKLYSAFQMTFNDELGNNVQSFMQHLCTYKKNEFQLSDAEKTTIREQLIGFMSIYNYH